MAASRSILSALTTPISPSIGVVRNHESCGGQPGVRRDHARRHRRQYRVTLG
jgi:hypothetical protein